jgi:hypothetical protein
VPHPSQHDREGWDVDRSIAVALAVALAFEIAPGFTPDIQPHPKRTILSGPLAASSREGSTKDPHHFTRHQGSIGLRDQNYVFLTPQLALFIIATELLIGGIAGALTSLVIARSRATRKIVLSSATAAGIIFLLSIGIAGWAGSHAEWYNGKLVDRTSWGENLYWRNRIVENQYLLSFAGSIIAAALTTTVSLRRTAPRT